MRKIPYLDVFSAQSCRRGAATTSWPLSDSTMFCKTYTDTIAKLYSIPTCTDTQYKNNVKASRTLSIVRGAVGSQLWLIPEVTV